MEKLSRRYFLKTAARGIAAATTLSLVPEQVSAAPTAALGVSGNGGTPNFKFNAKGKFKILQLADTHFVGVHEDRSAASRLKVATTEFAEKALKNITRVLEAEKPDLVIHTGDIIYYTPAKENLKTILSPMAKLNIPFAVTLGNHDEEFGMSRQEVFDYVRTLPCNINTPSVPGIHNASNNVITLSGRDNRVQRVFYLLDSGRKFMERSKSYDFIRHDQIEWYCRQSEHFKQLNGGEKVPGMMFMHIPLREFNDGVRDKNRIVRGNLGEEPGSAQYNSGLFATTIERGDIDAFVFGHEHDNDCAMWYMDKFFIYGRFSGYDSVYSNLKPEGVRVFEFTEGEEGFRSWIRLYNGETQQNLRFPEDFKSSLYK